MRTTEEIEQQLEILDIDLKENDPGDLRYLMAASQHRALLWVLGRLETDEL